MIDLWFIFLRSNVHTIVHINVPTATICATASVSHRIGKTTKIGKLLGPPVTGKWKFLHNHFFLPTFLPFLSKFWSWWCTWHLHPCACTFTFLHICNLHSKYILLRIVIIAMAIAFVLGSINFLPPGEPKVRPSVILYFIYTIYVIYTHTNYMMIMMIWWLRWYYMATQYNKQRISSFCFLFDIWNMYRWITRYVILYLKLLSWVQEQTN